jgi:hypothetical protein
MAHVRQDTLCTPTEWWKHMREQKRRMSKKERKAAQNLVENEFNEIDDEEEREVEC